MTKAKKAEKESWLGQARKDLVTQAITILLLPASIAITFYLTKHYSAPKPKVQSISVHVITDNSPSNSIRTSIIQDHYLGEFIWKEPVLQTSKASQDWLNGSGKWDEECKTTFETLIPRLKANLESYSDFVQWNGKEHDEPYTTTLATGIVGEPDTVLTHHSYHTDYESSESKATILAILNDMSGELQKCDGTNSNRTGDIDFTVTVLNPGDSDGVIYRDAIAKFGNETMKVRAENNVDIKAHSFAMATFSTKAGFEGDGDRTGNEKFAKAIKKGESISVELGIIISDKAVSSQVTIPPVEKPAKDL